MCERKETETPKEAKERKWRAQAPKERLGGSPKFPVRRPVQFFVVLAILGAVRDRVTESGLPSEVNWGARRTNKAIYSLSPGNGVLGDPMFWEHLGGALGPRFGVFYLGKTINSRT